MELHLPAELPVICDLSTLKLQSGSFVEDDLRQYFSDVRGYPSADACNAAMTGSSLKRLNHSDDQMFSKTGFTHSDLLRWQIEYAG